ncbi:MAG: DUF4385 domain-containing protein [Chloroflexia bacterium]|nr:DUF4385 domain-containing protein [Chloroflexia bacterium]
MAGQPEGALRSRRQPAGARSGVNPAFDYDLDFSAIDFRKQPERYRVGKGEQGVLLVEPYKSEILPHWRFRTPDIARESADAIFAMFLAYKEQADFVGMDMARKFLQMGFTRARRYANHKSGRKWSPDRTEVLPPELDPVKAESARIFYERYRQAREDGEYQRMKREHEARSRESKVES